MYYLYVKTHNITGLKYLGYTQKDVYSYRGSGIDWKEHIEEYGNDVSTEILLETEDKNILNETGRHYSSIWNVAKSDKWANRIPETGGGSLGFKGKKHSDELKARWKKERKGMRAGIPRILSEEGKYNIRAANSKPKSEEHKKKLSEALVGRSYKELGRRSLTEEECEKISASKRGKPRSEETKKKLREASLRYWAEKRMAADV